MNVKVKEIRTFHKLFEMQLALFHQRFPARSCPNSELLRGIDLFLQARDSIADELKTVGVPPKVLRLDRQPGIEKATAVLRCRQALRRATRS